MEREEKCMIRQRNKTFLMLSNILCILLYYVYNLLNAMFQLSIRFGYPALAVLYYYAFLMQWN